MFYGAQCIYGSVDKYVQPIELLIIIISELDFSRLIGIPFLCIKKACLLCVGYLLLRKFVRDKQTKLWSSHLHPPHTDAHFVFLIYVLAESPSVANIHPALITL